MLIYDKSGRELRHKILLSFFVVEIWPSEGSTLLRFLVWPNFFSASFYVFEMVIFRKLMKRRFQWYIGLPTFLLLFLLCVQSSKSCCKGSILEPPPLREDTFKWIFWHNSALESLMCLFACTFISSVQTKHYKTCLQIKWNGYPYNQKEGQIHDSSSLPGTFSTEVRYKLATCS